MRLLRTRHRYCSGEEAASDFEFEPVLVDNLFFERIDTGAFTAQLRG
ncbi:hypothetical protein [Massilia sp. H6]|nr:hypothetical protein [Massilia sp. H6]UVW30726.1 hypothetical protein NRS07_20025 [Massilia sp. H6]